MNSEMYWIGYVDGTSGNRCDPPYCEDDEERANYYDGYDDGWRDAGFPIRP
jgi:hypothetical protein